MSNGSNSSGGGGGGNMGQRLAAMYNAANGGAQNIQLEYGSELEVAPFMTQGDWNDNGNPALMKWQGQTDDKAANYLAKVDRQTDLNQIQQQTGDPWAFYDNPYQKMVEQFNLNKGSIVLSKQEFDEYIRQTGAQRLYRGWSGQNAIDRYKKSPNNHVGNGINGDGIYMSANRGTARGYGPDGTQHALSPFARVVSLSDVNAAINNSSSKFKSALRKAGSRGTRTYGVNEGQAQMAIKMGFNTIDAGWAVIGLSREAVVTCDTNAW